MARSVTQIQQEILNEISNDSTLNTGLTSTSTTAFYRVFTYVVAVAINLLEIFTDKFKREVTNIRNQAIPATEEWFVWRAKRFQYDPNTPQILKINDDYSIDYETIDETKQIVTVASCITLPDRTVSLKVAKGEQGNLEALNSQELDSLISYFQKLRSAGQQVVTVSLNPDKIYISGEIYYDGQYLQQDVLSEIENNINDYLTNLEFDGTVRYQKVVDAIQAAEGVKDLRINEMAGYQDGQVFSNRTKFDRIYNPAAGYLVISDDSPLENSLQLIAT